MSNKYVWNRVNNQKKQHSDSRVLHPTVNSLGSLFMCSLCCCTRLLFGFGLHGAGTTVYMYFDHSGPHVLQTQWSTYQQPLEIAQQAKEADRNGASKRIWSAWDGANCMEQQAGRGKNPSIYPSPVKVVTKSLDLLIEGSLHDSVKASDCPFFHWWWHWPS